MSSKAYEDACLRAELFGEPLPKREEFIDNHKHLDVTEFEEIDIRTAENTAILNEDMKTASGGLTELNTILTSTQNKLNRFKGVCDSVTGFFRLKLASKSNLSYSSEPGYVGQTNYDKDYVPPPDDGNTAGYSNQALSAGRVNQSVDDVNAAIENLKKIQENEQNSCDNKIKNNIDQQLTSQMGKLDQMLNQAERAQTSLQHQNKQMRSFLR